MGHAPATWLGGWPVADRGERRQQEAARSSIAGAREGTRSAAAGSRLGTGTMIVLDDKTCPVGMAWNMTRFFARESCGFCTPCWSGLGWAERILKSMEDGRGQSGEAKRELQRNQRAL